MDAHLDDTEASAMDKVKLHSPITAQISDGSSPGQFAIAGKRSNNYFECCYAAAAASTARECKNATSISINTNLLQE
jgi:hypothetical protein